MITESLTTTGQHVLCQYCGRPIRFFPVTVATSDASGQSMIFLAPYYHEDCRAKAHAVICSGMATKPKKKEIPYWAKMNQKHQLKRYRGGGQN